MKKKKLYIPINDEYLTVNTTIAKNQLINILSDNFIPWTECFRKCGWAENCKHTAKLKHRGEDQKCCVVVKILENLINCTYGIFRKLNYSNKQRYLLGVTKYLELVVSLKDWMGAIYDENIVKWSGEWAPNLYGGLLRERRKLDEIASLLKNIKSFNTEIPVYLVEGSGDKELFQTFVKYSQMANFDQLENIDMIFGRDNVKKGRIDLLIKNKIRRGERTIVILDGDGSKTKTFYSLRKLWKQKLIMRKDIFVFKHNIELSFPPDVLVQAIEEYIKNFKLKAMVSKRKLLKIICEKGNFIKKCEIALNININKVIFDKYLGFLLANIVEDNFRQIIEKRPPFDNYEIFRLLRFVVMHY